MKIAVRGGHNTQATGASALLDEVTEDRKVKDAVIKYLKTLGHEVLDVTPGPMSSRQDLAYGVNKANDWNADLFISIHFNKAYSSYKGAIGTEAWLYLKDSKAKSIGTRITNKMAGLGFKNRGIKDGFSKGLYEIKQTKMSAIIEEVCFVEATDDVSLYKKVGPDTIGKVIAEAIGDKLVSDNTDNSSEENINKDDFKPLPLRCTDDVIAFAKEVKRFKKGDKLTSVSEISRYYRLQVENGAWIHKDDVKFIDNLGYPYGNRKKLEVLKDVAICWANKIKQFNKGDLITAIEQISGYYKLDINGKYAWIPKDKVENR